MDPFITPTELSEFTGQTVTDEFVCAAACDVVRSLTEQDVTLVEDDEIVLDGTATDALLLPQLPVVEVSEVSEDGDEVDAEDYVVNDAGVLLKPGGKWCQGRQNVAITYSHGFAYDPDEDVNEIPADLRMVALSIAQRLLRNTDAKSLTLGSYSISFATEKADIGTTEKLILDKYRR